MDDCNCNCGCLIVSWLLLFCPCYHKKWLNQLNVKRGAFRSMNCCIFPEDTIIWHCHLSRWDYCLFQWVIQGMSAKMYAVCLNSNARHTCTSKSRVFCSPHSYGSSRHSRPSACTMTTIGSNPRIILVNRKCPSTFACRIMKSRIGRVRWKWRR